MQLINRQIEAENLKGEGVIFEKRVFDLAKQAVASLQGETSLLAAQHGVMPCKPIAAGNWNMFVTLIVTVVLCSLCRLPSPTPLGVGVRSCEMTTVANTIRTACKFRALTKQQQRELSEAKRVSA